MDHIEAINALEKEKRQIIALYFNEKRPCKALNYDTPVGFRKRFFRGEIPRKNTFEKRELSVEPKFVKKHRKQTYLENVSTFENEND